MVYYIPWGIGDTIKWYIIHPGVLVIPSDGTDPSHWRNEVLLSKPFSPDLM